jgi:hypothetical protein
MWEVCRNACGYLCVVLTLTCPPPLQLLEEARSYKIPIVDDLAAATTVLSRQAIRSALPDLPRRTDDLVAWSPAHLIHNEEEMVAHAKERSICGENLFLVKPNLACGLWESHSMALVLRSDSLLSAVRLDLRLLRRSIHC